LAEPAMANVTVLEVNEPPLEVSLELIAVKDVIGLPALPVVSDSTQDETFRYEIITQPGHGEVEVVGEGMRYIPQAEFAGTDSFIFRAIDSAGGSVTGSASVVIEGLGTPSDDLLLAIELDENNFQFGFDTQVGTRYFLDYKDDLGEAFWRVVAVADGDGSPQSVTDPSPESVVQRFYRLRARPIGE